MGLLRSLAKRVVGKLGGEAAPASAPSAAPPSRTPAASTAPASAPAAAPIAPPVASAASTAAKAPRTGVSVMAGEEGPVADADALANLDAGVQEIKERVEAGEPVVLLDVREPHETAHGVISGARLIPLGQLEARWEELAKCDEIVCYCAHGMRSQTAAVLLRQKGLFNATSLVGGVAEWQARGGKLVPVRAK